MNNFQDQKSTIVSLLAGSTGDRPVKSRVLEHSLNMSGPQLRTAIRELRREGHLIANCHAGYYMARTENEIEPTIKNLKARALSQLKTIGGLKRGAQEIKQKRLFGI